jgi:DDE family transposase
MTRSEDHQGSYAMLIVAEVSHARISIIADHLVVARTDRALPAPPTGADRRPARSGGGGTRSARRGIRHRLAVVLTAAVCAVVAGCRSYTAIGGWVTDLPSGTALLLLGIDTDRRPSEAMIRRLLQAVDPDLKVCFGWLMSSSSRRLVTTRRARHGRRAGGGALAGGDHSQSDDRRRDDGIDEPGNP